VVERAGLAWSEAQPRLDTGGWRAELEANLEALAGLGLWGVPSFCVRGPGQDPPYATWGQDRLWRVEQEIARRSRPA
jgi:2-hydroxychromene-2-carboxylate isomerase